MCLYGALTESSEHQASLGKRAMGLKVTDLEGKRISFGQALGRSFLKEFFSISVLGWLTFLAILFTKKKQGGHARVEDELVAGNLQFRFRPRPQPSNGRSTRMSSVTISPPRKTGKIRALFFAEMALSPFVAALALLVPVAAHWGVFRYVPAIGWCAILLQCLFTFRWRGLWFVVGLPVAFLAIEVFLVAAQPERRVTEPAAVSVQ